MNFLRKYWQDVGGIVAIAVGAWLLTGGHSLSRLEVLLWLSFAAILLHQWEEYRWPGYFPGIFNIVMFRSPQPAAYPLNRQSAMIINLLIAYGFYLPPVFWPEVIWLGLGPIFMGLFQLFWHGLVLNRKLGSWYNPGLAAVVCLHVPVGAAYLWHISSQHLASTGDWLGGIAYFIIATYVLIIKGNLWLKNSASPHAFSAQQLGPFNRQALK